MPRDDLDEIDWQILALLQADARRTATDIADEIGVSDTTVLNRLERLEDDGVLTDYRAVVDYEQAGYLRPFLLTCTAPIAARESLVERTMEVPGVVTVVELMTGRRNMLVEAVGEDPEDLTRIASQLDELGVEVVDETAIRTVERRPLAYHRHRLRQRR